MISRRCAASKRSRQWVEKVVGTKLQMIQVCFEIARAYIPSSFFFITSKTMVYWFSRYICWKSIKLWVTFRIQVFKVCRLCCVKILHWMNIRQGQWVYSCRTLSGLLDICIWEWDGHFNSSYSSLKVMLRLSTFEFCSRYSNANQRRPEPCWSLGRRTSTSQWERLKTPQPLSKTSDLSSWKGWAWIVTQRSGLLSQLYSYKFMIPFGP